MKETKVLMVVCDSVSEPTLREFLLLGGYRFSVAYVQEAEPPLSGGSEQVCHRCGKYTVVPEGFCPGCGATYHG